MIRHVTVIDDKMAHALPSQTSPTMTTGEIYCFYNNTCMSTIINTSRQ